MKTTSREIEIPFLLALIPLVTMIAAMAITIIVFEGSPHVPLALGAVVLELSPGGSAINGKPSKKGPIKESAWHFPLF